MERAQTRMLLVLAAVLLTVVGLLYGMESDDDEPVDAEATEIVWPRVELDEIVAVRVERRADVPLALEKSEGEWWVREPFDDRAEDDAVIELLDDLREIHRGIPVDGASERAGEFGLGEPPEATAIITRADGSTQQVEVGIAVPVGYRTYMRAAAGGIVAVNGDANETLQRRAVAFRDHHLFRFEPSQVRSVRIQSAAGVLEVHGERLRWWLEGYSRAEPDRVDDLVLGLLDLRFDVVLGLEDAVAEPRYEVVVTLADGSTHTARFGRESPMGVITMAGDRVGAVYPDSLALLGQGPTDLADPSAIPLDLDRDALVRITVGERERVATHDGPAWEVEGRDDGEVWDALTELSEVPAVIGLEPLPVPTETWASLVVQRSSERWEVRVGPLVDDGTFRVAIDTAGGSPYRIPAEPLEQALSALMDSEEPAP